MFDVEVDVDKRSKQTTIINSRSLQLFHYIYIITILLYRPSMATSITPHAASIHLSISTIIITKSYTCKWKVYRNLKTIKWLCL